MNGASGGTLERLVSWHSSHFEDLFRKKKDENVVAFDGSDVVVVVSKKS